MSGYAPSPGLHLRSGLDEVVVLRRDGQVAHVLEGPAAVIWHLLEDRPQDHEGLVAALCECYLVSAEDIEQDVREVLADLERAYLVEQR